ncbi:unnamed protein product [Allacma fusca]|uniref:Very-long-chain (3R)-3-hydroxyacyl-CoA dehydratase n=1 Tax=Allacma fusca TaxID=39272 RepID=A0A8J2JI91_9HEXA|nr:unnamed protein product [Allacma fusca]
MSDGNDWVHLRSPFVYWSQTESTVSLRVDIRNSQNPKIHIEDTRVVFDAAGRGALGENVYHFDLEFPHTVNPKASTYRVLDRDIDILIQKEEKGWWSKITTSHRKPAWLKVDFDRWKSPDDEDEVEIPPDVLKDYPSLYDNLQKDEFGYKIENMRNVYLFLYNFFQFVGFLYIVGVLNIRYMRDGPAVFEGTYELIGHAMRYCQLLQFLEVVHPILGFTKTGVALAAMQVGGRALVLFVLIHSEERVQKSPAIFFLFLVWCTVELTRYPYYMLQISKYKVYLVTWLRYSAWIILYPLGFVAEAVVIFQCIPYFIESGKYSWTLPNSWNVTFSLPTIMRLYLLFGLFPLLYTFMRSMQRARNKALGIVLT